MAYETNLATLLRFDGTNGSTTLTDIGYLGLTGGCVGTAALSTAQFKFGTASLKTGNAAGNYGRLPASKLLDFASADFTLEGFVWPVSQGSSYGAIIGRWDDSNSAAQDFLLWRAADGSVNGSINGAQVVAGAAGDLPTGAFAHVALTRQGTALTVWVGGVAKGTGTFSGAINCTASQVVTIGQATSATSYLEAYFDEFAFTLGVCRYTGTFTPPTVAYAYFANPLPTLLLRGDGADASTAFTDSSGYNRSVTVTAGAKLSTASPKYGSAAMRFSGSQNTTLNQDRIDVQVPDALLTIGTQDFTIEAWVNMQSLPSSGLFGILIDWRPASTNGAYPCLFVDTNGKVTYFVSNASQIVASTALAVGTYAHVALVRKSGTTSMYLNGVPVGSVADAVNYLAPGSNRVRIGASAWDASSSINAHVDDLVVIVGVARYNSSFTPTGPYPDPPPRKSYGTRAALVMQSRGFSTLLQPYQHVFQHHGQTDFTWGGKGRVAGQTTVNNVPTAQPIRLMEMGGGAIVRRKWSDANGNYSFDFIRETDIRYMVLGQDYGKVYNAVVQDNITPDIMPLYVAPADPGVLKRAVTVTPAGSGLGTDYPVLIRIGENPFSLNYDMLAAFKKFPSAKDDNTVDIKFTDSGGTELDFWLERVTGTAPYRTAYYWVRIPGNLNSGSQAVVVNYWGAVPTKTSNGANTFPMLFDDFNYANGTYPPVVAPTKWQAHNDSGGIFFNNGSSSASVQGKIGPGYVEGRSVATFSAGVEAIGQYNALANTGSSGAAWPGLFCGFVTGALGSPATVAAMMQCSSRSATGLNINAEAEATTTGDFTGTRRSSGRFQVAWGADGSAAAWLDEVLMKTRTGVNTGSTANFMFARVSDYNQATQADYIMVRKYIPGGVSLSVSVETTA